MGRMGAVAIGPCSACAGTACAAGATARGAFCCSSVGEVEPRRACSAATSCSAVVARGGAVGWLVEAVEV